MTFYEHLKQARSEEDVKDAYIKALGLKGFTKGLIDIQTNEIWFEAKDTGKHSSYAMFTQLLHYVQVALNAGEAVPPFLAVIDTDNRAVRDEYKLNRPDVGWYQIRNALKKRNESDDYAPVSFDVFEQAYKALTEKLRPMVYELGFLRG